MSDLSYMDKLLDGVEVEWKALGEIYKFQYGKGNTIPKAGGEYPVYGSNGIVGSHHEYNSEDAPVIGHIGAYAGIVNWGKGKHFVTYNGVICRMKSEEVLPQYAYYILLLQNFGEKSNSASQPFVSYHILETPVVPIPPLHIQAEIVRILDAFTELTAELTAELVARQQQYSYYRNQLLMFEEGEVEWKALGDLAENLDSKRKPITSGLRESGDIPYYGASGIVDYVKDYIFDGDYLLVSEDGANLTARNTPIAFSISGKNWVNNHAHVLNFKTYAERRYVEYYLNSIDLTPYISGAAQPKLNQKNLNSIKIPSPSLKEKERIVTILDKFDALTTSLTDGLPREIALRQQQYEYYRELLLSFPKAEVANHD